MTTDKFGPGNPGYDSVITLGKTLKYEVKALHVAVQYVGTATEVAALGASGNFISAGMVGYQAYHGDYEGAAKTAIGAGAGAVAGGAAANAAELAIFEYINGFYNPRRRHSALGWKSPLAFEAQAA